jgi:YVTN family beta-propeller protein
MIKLRLIALIILDIIVLVLVVVLSNFTYAQENPELHQKTLYYLYEKHITSKQNAHITVGTRPRAIGVDEITHRIYVANAFNNTVSVIDGQNNTKIAKDIPVGRVPSAIAVDGTTYTIYVANAFNNIVSVIDGNTNRNIKNITVGQNPRAIAFSMYRIYVANYDDKTVSVIDGQNNTKIGDIPVGRHPLAIAVDGTTNTTYVGLKI